MYWLSFPFLRFTICFSTGIFLARLGWSVEESIIPIGWLACWLLLFILPGRSVVRISSAWLLLIFTGFFCYQRHNNLPAITSETTMVQLSRLEKQGDWNRYLVERNATRREDQWIPARGKMLIYLRDSLLHPGQRLLITKKFSLPQAPANPYAFNYRRYLLDRHIAGQVFLRDGDYQLSDSQQSISHRINRWREFLLERLEGRFPDPSHYQVLAGILLGEKSGLDEEQRRIYGVTGSMHVLAVSGLHVGILLMVLRFFFYFLPNFPFWRLVNYLLCIGLLILYAALTNFSPSVVRAVTFFVIHSLGLLLGRKGRLTHTISLTAFLMLVNDPVQLFQAGFQLSFAAVAGIILFVPRLRIYFTHPRPLVDKPLEVLAVSLGAQSGTFFFTIYYFHLFSLTALPASLVVIPAAFLLIVCGGICLVLPHGLPEMFFATITRGILDGMTACLEWLASLPGGYIPDVYLPWWIILLWSTLPIWWVLASCRKKVSYGILSLAILFFLGVIRMSRDQPQIHQYFAMGKTENKLWLTVILPHKTAVFYDKNILNPDKVKDELHAVLLNQGCSDTETVIYRAYNMNSEMIKFGPVRWMPGTATNVEAKVVPLYEGPLSQPALPGGAVSIERQDRSHVRLIELGSHGFYEMNLSE